MISARLRFFMTLLLILFSIPALAIDVVLEGGRKLTAQKVTYEKGKFRIVSGTSTFDVHAQGVEFLEADESNVENL